MTLLKLFVLAGALLSAAGAAQQVPIGSGSVAATVDRLKPGQFVWVPEAAPEGPVLLVVNIPKQRTVLYRNGVPIAASTVSTGRPGYSTPTGIFTILQKRVEHYSSTYDNAPMPYMQRLTWRGIALHAGSLPGYPASHGCIRLPKEFARLLYGVTRVGMTVAVTDAKTYPRFAPGADIVLAGGAADIRDAHVVWNPERSPEGPVSIVVSSADRRAIVIRNGIIIGSAPVSIDGTVPGTWAYALTSVDSQGQHWFRIPIGSEGSQTPVTRDEWQRFRTPEAFRRAVAQIVAPGTTVVVTADSLQGSTTESQTTVLEGDPI